MAAPSSSAGRLSSAARTRRRRAARLEFAADAQTTAAFHAARGSHVGAGDALIVECARLGQALDGRVDVGGREVTLGQPCAEFERRVVAAPKERDACGTRARRG